VNVKEIQKLMEAFKKNGLSELELADENFNLKLNREIAGGSVTTVFAPQAGQIPGPSPTLPVTVSGTEDIGQSGSQLEGLERIESPIIGTFYRAPNPDAEPYVAIGDVVRKGQVLCIIEAMKIMNEIESEIEGTVVKIFPKNGEAVEYGQELFAVKPV